MQYQVIVKKRKLEGFDDVYEEAVYLVAADKAEDAANSVVTQKKAKSRKEIKAVMYQDLY